MASKVINLQKTTQAINNNMINKIDRMRVPVMEQNLVAEAKLPSKGNTNLVNIPNILTMLRVCMIPVFMGFFLTQRKVASVVLYVVSCLTDFVDGWIARRFNMTSDFGVFMDPVADKLMVSTVLLLLVCQIPTWWFVAPVALIINREIAVSALRAWMAEKNLVTTVKVSSWGKWKTALQMISTTLLLMSCTNAMSFDIGQSLGVARMTQLKVAMTLFYAATFLTIKSGMDYFVAAIPALKAATA
tara:strand:- start:56 stop:787 length:732 start_codon:yes stop_codon:yes gene_type:complete